MKSNENTINFSALPSQEKTKQLFLRQKELLDTFLSHGAITQAQYDKILGNLIIKMNLPVD